MKTIIPITCIDECKECNFLKIANKSIDEEHFIEIRNFFRDIIINNISWISLINQMKEAWYNDDDDNNEEDNKKILELQNKCKNMIKILINLNLFDKFFIIKWLKSKNCTAISNGTVENFWIFEKLLQKKEINQ